MELRTLILVFYIPGVLVMGDISITFYVAFVICVTTLGLDYRASRKEIYHMPRWKITNRNSTYDLLLIFDAIFFMFTLPFLCLQSIITRRPIPHMSKQYKQRLNRKIGMIAVSIIVVIFLFKTVPELKPLLIFLVICLSLIATIILYKAQKPKALDSFYSVRTYCPNCQHCNFVNYPKGKRAYGSTVTCRKCGYTYTHETRTLRE